MYAAGSLLFAYAKARTERRLSGRLIGLPIRLKINYRDDSPSLAQTADRHAAAATSACFLNNIRVLYRDQSGSRPQCRGCSTR
jgi:hypothetical protein